MPRLRWSRLLTLMFAASIGTGVLVAGCADGADELAGPEHPPIPAFSIEQTAQCAEWSCEIQDCQQDPGQYGACCIQAVDAQHPYEAEKPSCGNPGYCAIYPNRCTEDTPCNPGPPPSYCYSATVDPYSDPACYTMCRFANW